MRVHEAWKEDDGEGQEFLHVTVLAGESELGLCLLQVDGQWDQWGDSPACWVSDIDTFRDSGLCVRDIVDEALELL